MAFTMTCLSAPLACVLLLAVPAAAGDLTCAAGGGSCFVGEATRTEAQIEEEEAAEVASADVRLLQTQLQQTSIAAGDEAGAEKAHAGSSDAANAPVSKDHNGNVCMLCGKPLPERLGGKAYTEFRKDCGSRSSPTGPVAADLRSPVSMFSKAAGMNGFCELNFAKSCADAIANKDYLYWAKSMDFSAPHMQDSTQWEASYCHLNAFLEPNVAALQHNFTGMQAKAKELCSTKYAKYGMHELSFVDMMAAAQRRELGSPTRHDAELLAAWNCAMGDLGCDMAMCAYSFCDKGGSLGLYQECRGWHPVEGMPAGRTPA